MRLGLAQIDSVVGDLDGNAERIVARIDEAKNDSVDVVLFPELITTGYPPEDLLLRPGFIRAAERKLEELSRACRGITAFIGTPHFDRDLYNACAVCAGGEVKALYRKRFLPNYGVFDEDRYFAPGRDLILLELDKTLIGATVCEDMWQPGPPATDLALAGAELLVNISASPYHVGKEREREEMFVTRARDNTCFVAFCNAVGAQDELIFDGHSVVIDDEGTVIARAPGFEETLLVVDVDPKEVVGLGLRDYVEKNGFRDGVVVGVSGGIDSAVTAALAAEALGPERVHCVSMPSRYSSEATRADARSLAESLGCSFREIPIGAIVDAFDAGLQDAFAGTEPDLTEENIQARARGVLLMALSNKFGWMLVATGNKSELSVGYATLYGDMAGGFALLKDVYKTDVFRLARYLNERAGRGGVSPTILGPPPS